MTCGECVHFHDDSCMNLKSNTPLHDLVLRSDPACAAFEQRPAAELVPVAIKPARKPNPLDILNPETLAKLNPREVEAAFQEAAQRQMHRIEAIDLRRKGSTFLDRTAEADR
jgi:hypothetical protein